MTPRREPVFILSPARSCSTVTTALLGGHPDIYALPEMLTFSASTVGDFLDESRRRPDLPPGWSDSRISGVLRAVAELHDGGQESEAILRARQWLGERADWTTTRLLDHLLDLVHPRTALEKSPGTIGTEATLAACLNAYPGARFIHLTRHPVATQRSMHQHWRGVYARREELVVRSASAWYLGHHRVLTTLRELPESRWIRVRAEDVLGEPEAVLPRILRWLDLPADAGTVAAMLRTEQWTFAGNGHQGGLFGGDPGFLKSPRLRRVEDPGPVRFDAEWGLPPAMCALMTELAGVLGYPTEGEA